HHGRRRGGDEILRDPHWSPPRVQPRTTMHSSPRYWTRARRSPPVVRWYAVTVPTAVVPVAVLPTRGRCQPVVLPPVGAATRVAPALVMPARSPATGGV